MTPGPYIATLGEGSEKIKGPCLVIKFVGSIEEQREWCRRMTPLFEFSWRGGELGMVFEKAMDLVRAARSQEGTGGE